MYQAGIPTRAQQQRAESPWLALLCLITHAGSMPCQGRTCLWILFYRKWRGESSGGKTQRDGSRQVPGIATVLPEPLNCTEKSWEENIEAC